MDRDDLVDWIKQYISRILGADPSEIEVDRPLASYGLDSTAAVGLSGDLSELLGWKFDEGVLFRFPTISTLADHVLSVRKEKKEGAGGSR